MHEGALTENLFEHVLAHAREAGARRVTRVKVTIGALSDATPELIEFYFKTLSPGSIAEQAVLEFDTAPGQAKCPKCGKEFEIDEIYSACPACGTFPVTILGGNGVYLTSLEIEADDDRHEHLDE